MGEEVGVVGAAESSRIRETEGGGAEVDGQNKGSRVFVCLCLATGALSSRSQMKKRKPKRSSPADAFRKQLMRWGAEGRRLQRQYDKLHKRGEVQRIEMFELGFEPLLVEVTPIRVDDLGTMLQAPPGDVGPK